MAATAAVRLPKTEIRHNGGALDWLVERGLAIHDLPCPDGQGFLETHLMGGTTWGPTAEEIRDDRLVPEIVYLKIRHGLAAHLVSLEGCIAGLVAEGTLGRSELIGACLESLTVETLPGSQRATVKLLSPLGLASDDLPGGLPYLLGVIATRDGMVGSYFLPMALALVADESDVLELSKVIAGRKELKLKRALLAALADPKLLTRVGSEGLREGLELLGHGVEDSSLLQEINTALVRLGGAPATTEPEAALGLWDLDVDPGAERTWPAWVQSPWNQAQCTWQGYLNRANEEYPDALEYIADSFLRELATSGADPLASHCRQLRLGGRLGIQRLIRLTEPAILSGGLRVLWPVLLEAADAALAEGTTPAGLADLLRLLRRYLAEVPDRELPPSLIRFARAKGSTKSQQEARALIAALGHAPTTSPARSHRAERPDRRLWETHAPYRAEAERMVVGWRFWLRRLADNRTVAGAASERDRFRDELLALSSQGLLDPSITVPATRAELEDSPLPLVRLAESFQYLFERGGMGDLWPVAMAVADVAASDTPRRHGLVNLLSNLAAYAPEVPPDARDAPASIRWLATEGGRTKTQAAARELLALLDAGIQKR